LKPFRSRNTRMATEAIDVVARQRARSGSVGRFVDRWIYVFMAVFYLVTVLAGFVPDSVELIPLIRAGQRPPLSLIWHLHAVVMGSWILLFLAQTVLVAIDRRDFHKRLGIAAVAIVPLMVLTMMGMIFTGWRWAHAHMPPPVLAQFGPVIFNVLIEQIHAIIVVPLLVGWALLVRKSDPETHKRFMVQAILPAITAAIDRLHWLPTSGPNNYTSSYAYVLLCLSPVLINDLVQRRRLHRAYVIGLGLMLLFYVVNRLLWNSTWWLATAPKILNIAL
jgi:uncharacterized membrane protein YozB (DUF420 family)